MEQQNDLLKQTLIKQYSKLNGTSETKLTDSLKEADWWDMEQVRVIKQRKRTLIYFRIVWVFFILIVARGLFTLFANQGSMTSSYFTLLTIFFSSISVHMLHSRNEERIKLFEIMQLVFQRNVV